MPLLFVRNDITRMRVDAIVNAANESLLGGGGVDGAIHSAAGPELLAECRTLGGCDMGDAKVTRAYRLPSKYVIHAVGPVWEGGTNGEKELLERCYRRSLELALERNCLSVAFPLISSDAYGYPKADAFNVAVETIRAFLETNDMMVYLVLFEAPTFLRDDPLVREMRSYIDDAYVAAHVDLNRRRFRGEEWRGFYEARRRKDVGEAAPSYSSADYSMTIGSCERTEEPDEAMEAEAAPAPQHGQDLIEESRHVMCAPTVKLPRRKPKDGKDPFWDDILRRTDKGFSETLLSMIDEKGMTDTECYRRANVDRKLFSKIRSNRAYRPGKQLVFAFAIALRLNPEETEMLLNRAGFAISLSSPFDLIVFNCIRLSIYDVDRVNRILYSYDMPLLGSSAK